MLALGEFSVSELALLSGVKPSTVRTILQRESDLVQRVGTVSTGRRGGQPYRWRLVSEAPARLRRQLQELETLGIGPWLGDPPSHDRTIPAGIVAAEHVLLQLIPVEPRASARAELLDLAQSQLDAAEALMASTPGLTDARVANHKRLVELLLQLERAEQSPRGRQAQEANRDVQEIIAELQSMVSEIEADPVTYHLRSRLASITQPPEPIPVWVAEVGTRRSRNNLPVEPNKFVGRQGELAELTAKLSDARVLTLRGPGGIGKTRLANNLASEVVTDFPDGAWLVELADAVEPDPIARLVAGAMGIKEEPGRNAVDTLSGALGSRRVLLILDSCETSIAASADLVGQLTRRCPWVHVLATSRESLGVQGEIIWDVPPLSTSDRGFTSSTSWFPQSEAMRLFTARASDAMPNFTLDRNAANVVAQLCIDLVGMPLGIELAAAQVRALSLEQIRARLTQKFESTTASKSPASGRRALMAAVDWIYGMLSEQEQILLRRLSVFSGWYLEMAEEVCSGNDIPRGKVSALLADLIDKSLVTLNHEVAGEARYGMLDTIREFAKDRLIASGEQLATSIRLRDYLLRFVENIVSVEFGSSGPTWRHRVTVYLRSYAERENYAAALSLCLDRRDPVEGLRLCSALRGTWIVRGESAEGADWFDRFLGLGGDVPSDVHATALVMRAELAFEQQDYSAATQHASAALEVCRDSQVTRAPGALRVLALVGLRTGNLDEALQNAEDAITDAREAEDEWEEGLAVSSLAAILARSNRFKQSRSTYELALEILKDNNGWGVAQTLFGLGELARTQDDYASASHYFARSLALYRDIDARPEISRCLAGLGWVALSDGDFERAASSLAESLELNVTMGQRLAIARGLEAFAALAVRQDDLPRAVRLLGAAYELRDAFGHPPTERGEQRIDDLLETAQERLGAAKVECLVDEGRKLPTQEAARLAIDGAQSQPRQTSMSKSKLTPLEQQIATLISHNFSTRAIAAQLFISPTSVGRHMATILAKLRLASRAQIADWVKSGSGQYPPAANWPEYEDLTK